MKYLFGPVPSRRLGISLGVDMVPYKTCTLGCVYCECGRTEKPVTQRKKYIDPVEVIRELDGYLAGAPVLDHVTFSGGGEPTLNSGIGEVVRFLKSSYPGYRLALLTNGTLLLDPAVREDIRGCDLIVPSLDAVSDEAFRKINNPCGNISSREIIEGIMLLKKESRSEIWVEVFIVPGVNDTPSELELLKDALLKIKPGKIQLNTLDRPAAEGWVRPAPATELEGIRRYFRPLTVEIIAHQERRQMFSPESSGIREKILGILARRPCTLDDLSRIFAFHIDALAGYLQELENSDKIISEKKERGVFYKIK